MVNNSDDLLSMYSSFADQLIQFKTNAGLSAAVYTQLTDVETELNGLMTYDRAIVKPDITKFNTVNQKVINENIYYTDVLPTGNTQQHSLQQIGTLKLLMTPTGQRVPVDLVRQGHREELSAQPGILTIYGSVRISHLEI